MPLTLQARLLLTTLSLSLWLGTATERALANATCSFAITDISFGNVDLTRNIPFTTTGTLTASCFGGGSNEAITICTHLAEGSGGAGLGGARYLSNGASQMQYNLYKEPSHSNIWGSLDWAYSPTPKQWIPTTDGSGNLNASTTIYARISSGQSALPFDLYTSSFTSSFAAEIEYKAGTETCNDIHNSADGTEYATFYVTANNTPSCTVSATALDFGSAGILGSNIDSSNVLGITCNSGLPYDVGLSGGLSGATDPTQRKMSLGPNDVTYGLYNDAARSVPWGSSIGTDTVASTGTGSQQSFTVYGRVPAQSTPPVGIYTDTIVVTVTY